MLDSQTLYKRIKLRGNLAQRASNKGSDNMAVQKLRKSAVSKVTTSTKASSELDKLFKEKMAGSKLDAKTVAKLGFKLSSAAQCPEGLVFKCAGFVIPYFDLSGKRTSFFRYRFLEQPKQNGFAGLVKRKPIRYSQVSGTINELYLPPVVDWRSVAKDKTLPIIITAGELKAASGSLLTPYPTIGLGGVWTWKSNKARQPMLQQFDEFEWEGRPVYIVYDSDAKTNPMVIQAENALAQALTARGAEPFITRLHELEDGKKCGLDDFLLYNSVSDLEELLENSLPWRAAKELHELNEEVVYVMDPGFVVRIKTLQKMSPQAFVGHHYSTRVFWEEQVSANGKTTMVKKVAPKEWISWPMRAEVNRMTYAPGDDRVTEAGELNVWPGWNCEPKKGDVKLWNELLNHLFEGFPDERKWLEQWLAWPLQHPGDKMYTYVLMWGLKHGTGKSLIGYCMKQIYGSNWAEIKDKHLEGNHNEWAENKQFIMGDEISIGDKRGMGDRVKGMITQEDVRIDIKYVPSYVVPDRINYYFTSNHPDSFFLEDDDRRAFVHEVKGGGLPDEFYARFERWIRADKYKDAPGPAALFHHLLNVDVSDFNPRARAPNTQAKTDMSRSVRSELGDWVGRLRECPEEVLKLGMHEFSYRLWTAEELFKFFDPDGKSRSTVNGFSRELRRGGFQQVANGMPVRTKTNGQCRLWAVRPIPKEIMLSQSHAAAYYDDERKLPEPKRSKVR
jgi:hypothetical protein